MIEKNDIYKSIKKTLETNSDVVVQNKDIKTPVPPCYYIKFINGQNKTTATDYIEDNVTFDIVYFSAEETLADLMEKEKLLKTLFSKPLKIECNNESVIYQEIDSIITSFNEDDYILNCKLEFNINQCVTDSESIDIINRYDEFDNEDYMEELEI